MTADHPKSIGLLPDFMPLQPSPFDTGTRAEGSQLASEAFIAALARYGTVPVDQFGAYRDMPDAETDWAWACHNRRGDPRWPGDPLTPRASVDWRFNPHDSLPRLLKSGALCALHDAGGPLLGSLTALRYASDAAAVPLTAVTHGLGGEGRHHAEIFALLLADSLPCDAIVCISKAAQSVLQRLIERFASALVPALGRAVRFAGEMPIIPWGVDLERFAPGDRKVARERLGLPTDGVQVLSVGRFSLAAKMDLAPLLLALDRLRRARRPVPALVLAGADAGGYGARISTLARAMGLSGQVRVLGSVPPAALPDLYRASDIFVSVSDTVCENLGLALLEAGASGLPVVASNWNGYRDVVLDGSTGFLVPTRWADCDLGFAPLSVLGGMEALLCQAQSVQVDVPVLADRLDRLVRSQELRQEMGAAARQRAEEVYSWQRIIRDYEALWAELALVARAAPAPRFGGPLASIPALDDLFAAWYSHLVTDRDLFRLTEAGAQAARGEAAIRVLSLMERCLSREALRAMCVRVDREGPTNWAAAVDWMERQVSLDKGVATRHLLWLMKYGYAEIVEYANGT